MTVTWVREAQFEWYGTARHYHYTIRINGTTFNLVPRFDGGWNLKIESAVLIAQLPEAAEDSAKHTALAAIRQWARNLAELP